MPPLAAAVHILDDGIKALVERVGGEAGDPAGVTSIKKAPPRRLGPRMQAKEGETLADGVRGC
jgi:hypothetical protein